MEAKNLRIGNYYDSVRGIEKLDEAEALQEIESYPNKFTPIPLTEEWLLKFGFELDSHDYYKCNNIYLRYYFTYKGLTNNKDYKAVLMSGLNEVSIDIKHVHQLQNLYFALTGEELSC